MRNCTSYRIQWIKICITRKEQERSCKIGKLSIFWKELTSLIRIRSYSWITLLLSHNQKTSAVGEGSTRGGNKLTKSEFWKCLKAVEDSVWNNSAIPNLSRELYRVESVWSHNSALITYCRVKRLEKEELFRKFKFESFSCFGFKSIFSLSTRSDKFRGKDKVYFVSILQGVLRVFV